jgi:hypothetical protein
MINNGNEDAEDTPPLLCEQWSGGDDLLSLEYNANLDLTVLDTASSDSSSENSLSDGYGAGTSDSSGDDDDVEMGEFLLDALLAGFEPGNGENENISLSADYHFA